MRSKVLLVAACLLLKGATAQAQAFTEGFDDITTLPASGWIQNNHSQPIGISNWFQGTPGVFPAQTGATNSYIGANFENGGGTATISNWLLTPTVTLVNGATLNFWTRKAASTFPDRMQVRMSIAGASTNIGTTATDVGDFTALLLDINPTYQPDPAYPVVWTNFNVVVTGVAAPVSGRLAFRYFVENGGPNGSNSDYIGIDTVAFTPGVAPATVAPVSLSVDFAGNQVLEPNEASVSVRPTWRNTSAVAIAAMTGTLGTFAGPSGPTYTVNDGTGDYGAIAPLTNATCTDCYAVTVTAATRPLTHWDSTAVETVSVGSTTKTWRLHVGSSFTDVPTSNPFYRFVETLLHKGVTGGCTATTYCPSNSTTRDQMAVFVLVAKEPAGFNPPACVAGSEMFTDVPASSPFCRWVEELARRGVVSGCGTGIYCPTSPATREQMSVFVLRTLDGTLNPVACVAGSEMFTDVPAASPFCKWIEELVRRGVVTGCGAGVYCPTANVTREQMGVFLTVTFGLTLYGL